MSVIWSAIFGYLFLAAFVLMIPDMDEAAKQGWNVFFWAFDQQVNPVGQGDRLPRRVRGAAAVRPRHRHLGVAHDLRLLARRRPAGSAALAKVSPTYRTPVAAIWTGAALSVLFVWGSSLVSVAGTSAYTIVVSCTVIFLFLSFTVPIVLGLLAWGTPKWDKMGPWNLGRGVFTLFAVLSILSMILIFVHRHPAAERLGALHHRRLLHPDGDRLVRLREPPLPGPAARRHHRQAPGGDRGGRKGGRRNRLSSAHQRPRPATCRPRHRSFISVQNGVPTEWPEPSHSTS